MFKKFAVSLMIVVFLFASNLGFFVPKVSAQTPTPTGTPPPAATINPWYKQEFTEWMTKVDDTNNPSEIFGERYTAAQVQWVIYGLVYILMDSTGDASTFSCIMQNTFAGEAGVSAECLPLIQSSIAKYSGGSGGTTYSPFTKPLASSEYFRSVADRLTLVSGVNAQGFGFQAVNPILGLWTATRNMTYMLMVLVIVAMAFMIMFRVKLSPQTVITVQSALPKVVITLILITFSYAIGGLMIDLMYVVMGLITALIVASGLSTVDGTWTWIFNQFTNISIIHHLFVYFLLFIITFLMNIPTLIALVAGGVVVGFATGGVGLILFLLPLVLFLIFFIWKSIKIIFLLLKSYVMIVLMIAFAPFVILVGAFSKKTGFWSWLRGLSSHLAVFPLAATMLYLSYYFLVAAMPGFLKAIWNSPVRISTDATMVTSWAPPFVPRIIMGQLNNGSDLLSLLVSFSILMLIPKAADIIKATIQGREFAYGSAIGAEAAMVTGAAVGASRMSAGGGVGFVSEGLAGATGRLGAIGTRLGTNTAGSRRQGVINAVGGWGKSGFRKWG